MLRHRIAIFSVALLALAGGLLAAGQPQEKRLDAAALETLMTNLGCDAAQKARLREIHGEFTKKVSATSSSLGIWGAYHKEDLILQGMLTEKQQGRQAEVLSTMRARDVPALAKSLGLNDEQKKALAKLRAAYEPKFVKLVLPTQKGQKLSDEERMSTHRLVLDMRADFLKAVQAELSEAQRAKLPDVLKQYPGLPGMIPEGDSLAYVLLAATLAHYSQPEYLDTLATTLELSAAQKEEFGKVGADLGAKLKASRGQVAAALGELAREERAAMMKVLTDDQRKKWSELTKLKGGA